MRYFAVVHMKADDSLGSWCSADTSKILIESGSTLDVEATIQEGVLGFCSEELGEWLDQLTAGKPAGSVNLRMSVVLLGFPSDLSPINCPGTYI